MIENLYYKCIKGLKENSNIEIIDRLTNLDYKIPSDRFLNRKQKLLKEEHNIILSNCDLEYFNLVSISVTWDSILDEPKGLKVLSGGFVFNGITDALLFPSYFWKGGVSLAPDEIIPKKFKHYEKLNWFEHLPEGIDDSKRGCFIRREGSFPPPIAFYNGSGWYAELDFNYYKYIELLFENYGFKGWQFFYIDIKPDMPRIDGVLEDMQVAVKTLPLLFPDRDWSYHKQRYQEVLDKIKK